MKMDISVVQIAVMVSARFQENINVMKITNVYWSMNCHVQIVSTGMAMDMGSENLVLDLTAMTMT